ncbi:FtsW/RodA/SpoVE family cell cycle protein [Blastococcus sp. URHD0036]|uniref:FtsW/RodA/SpoVE family cell cycle protein n=1 Tax=Blastococcus sp. URHD0036 TaxID=1380356 RepID=UPI000497CAD6|nr:FtsW/RodA/SpoVE family cell cycle protein [Blastococcus sp. URHD0036]
MAGAATDAASAGAPGTAAAAPTRRGTELLMLAFAVVITLAAQCVVDITLTGSLRPELATFGGWFTALWAVMHLAVRRFAPYADPLLLPAVALLTGLGLTMIHRLDLAGDQVGAAATREDAPVQLVWATLGVGLFVAVLVVVRDHRMLSRFAYTLALVGLVLLALPALLPASISSVNGAKIWIRLAGFSIQPGEFAKICLVIFFAAYLVDKRDVLALASRRVMGLEVPRARDLGPVVVAWLLSILVLVFERDLGSSLLLFGIFVVMLYVATERASWLVIGVLLFGAGASLAYKLFGHVQVRVDTWLDPFAYRDGGGYQMVQSLLGLGTGGLFGAGLGGGRPDQVPVAKSDFIAAAIGEELGLFGLVAVIVLYLVLVERGLRSSLIVRDAFGKLLAAGLSFAIAWQVFVVLGGVTGLLPLTGLTTPFVAYGGSSLVANFALLAILVRISDAARRPAAPPPPPGPARVVLGDAPTEVVRP